MSQQQRVRYHQYMRPRYTNPTYASSSVSGSLSMPLWPPNYQNKRQSQYGHQMRMSNAQNYGNNSYRNSYSNQIKQQEFHGQYSGKNYQYENSQAKTPSQRHVPIQQEKNRRTANPNLQAYQPRSQPYNQNQYGNSRFSNIGNSTLVRQPRITQRQIYEKQQSNYNIINIQPKQYNETIKKYPKYHLQNMDVNYYKKKQLEDEYTEMRNSGYNSYRRQSQQYPHENYLQNRLQNRQQQIDNYNVNQQIEPISHQSPKIHQKYDAKFISDMEQMRKQN